MICVSETTAAVTEHICSKMRQLFHQLRNVLNSESTTCFTCGHKRSDAALPAVYPFAQYTYYNRGDSRFFSFCDTHKGKFLNSPIYVFFRGIYKKWTLATNVKKWLVGKVIRGCGSFMAL